MFRCQECGKKFKTVRAAEKAANDGCPKCGGVDIDADYSSPLWVSRRIDVRKSSASSEPLKDSLHPEGF